MSGEVLRLVRIRDYPFVDMLDLCTIAKTTRLRPAVTNVNVSTHR
jgi:hypothetical protein